MKLHYAPGACSLGIHVLLEEIGKPFELGKLDLKSGDQQKPDFKALNPKSKVPTLERDDGSVLTEFPAIALWLARTNPHMQGFSRMFRPDKFAPGAADHDAVKAQGRTLFETGLGIVSKTLGDKDYLGGSEPSVADAALFYVSFWAGRAGVSLPPNCEATYRRMLARPAVARAMAAEGLA